MRFYDVNYFPVNMSSFSNLIHRVRDLIVTCTHTQMNNALKMALDQGATMKMIAEDWEFLQIQVRTLIPFSCITMLLFLYLTFTYCYFIFVVLALLTQFLSSSLYSTLSFYSCNFLSCFYLSSYPFSLLPSFPPLPPSLLPSHLSLAIPLSTISSPSPTTP